MCLSVSTCRIWFPFASTESEAAANVVQIMFQVDNSKWSICRMFKKLQRRQKNYAQ
ncbi:hypothetical protein ACSBR1_041048 [Camellia fascicularis]